jgi:serine protease Do
MKTQSRIFSLFMVVSVLVLASCSTASLALGPASAVGSKSPVVAQTTAEPAPTATAPAATAGSTAASGNLAAFETTLEQIYSQVSPSVVNIEVVESGTATSSQGGNGRRGFGNGNPFPFGNVPQAGPQTALGSGFVWSTDGYIVTNNHVVDGATNITVTFADGTTVTGTKVGNDPNADLAVIKVNVPASELHPVQLADSTQVKVGQLAIAIGNPFGLQGTMTEGIISGLERTLPVGSGTGNSLTGATYSIPDIIQTDASINPGNSGGVLVDDQGRVVGVTSAIESPVQSNAGVGFVIPSAIVQKVVPSLIKRGHYDHPWLGVVGTTLTPDVAKAMNLKDQQRGALVISVDQNGPAAKAGLKGSDQQVTVNGAQLPTGGDVITAINGQPVNRFEDLASYLFDSTTAGQTVSLTVIRGGQEQTISVTLGVLPTQ